MDEVVRREVLKVVQPAALEAARLAGVQAAEARDEVVAALQRELEAARYAARRAGKQFDAADPENRLVAAELERRWEDALQKVREVEQRLADRHEEAGRRPVPREEEWADLARDLEAVWQGPQGDARLKKRVVQALIKEVVADVDLGLKEIILVIHWEGGAHTELRLPRRSRGQCRATSADIIAAVGVLARVSSDRMIASILNRHGLRTGKGNRWTVMRVTSLRHHHDIPCYSAESEVAKEWLNLTKAARALGVSQRALRDAARRGEVPAEHPLAEGPWVFRRSDLETEAARGVAARAQQRSENARKGSA